MQRHVFLSFVEDLQLANLFRGQVKRENAALEFADYSVKVPFESYNADYIRQEIKNLINKVSVTVCLIGRTTYTSTWVNWEIATTVEVSCNSSYEVVENLK